MTENEETPQIPAGQAEDGQALEDQSPDSGIAEARTFVTRVSRFPTRRSGPRTRSDWVGPGPELCTCLSPGNLSGFPSSTVGNASGVPSVSFAAGAPCPGSPDIPVGPNPVLLHGRLLTPMRLLSERPVISASHRHGRRLLVRACWDGRVARVARAARLAVGPGVPL